MVYIIQGEITGTNLIDMKKALEYLNTNYGTNNLEVSGNGSNFTTIFNLEIADVPTLVSTIQALLKQFPDLNWNYFKRQ
ncbi:MAG: hypothetical protein ACE5ES_00195 [Candidatus Nanoarchaeia archaeon]